MQIHRTLRIMSLFVAALLWLSSCKTISAFDQYAYATATSLKVDALSLMDKATDTYDNQKTAIDAVNMQIEKAYEYEKHRPKNAITVKMWEILKNPERNLFGGFVKKWKNDSKLKAAFITEAKGQIAEAFDMIVELESQKIKPSDEKVNTFINANQ